MADVVLGQIIIGGVVTRLAMLTFVQCGMYLYEECVALWSRFFVVQQIPLSRFSTSQWQMPDDRHRLVDIL